MAKKNRAAAARRIVEEFALPEAQVVVPTAAPINKRAPFWSSAFKLSPPCASFFVPAACMVGQKKLTMSKLGLGRRATTPEFTKACKRAGGKLRKEYTKNIRPGKVELAFLSSAQAKRVGTLPGPNMRLCISDNKDGVLIPVTSPDAAAELQKEFVACVKNKKANAKMCALAMGQSKAGSVRLGGMLSGLFGRW